MTWYAYNQGILEGSEEAAPYLKPSGPLKLHRRALAASRSRTEINSYTTGLKIEKRIKVTLYCPHRSNRNSRPSRSPSNNPARPPSPRNPLHRVGRQKIRLKAPWQNRNQAKHSIRSRGRQMRHFGKLLSLLTKVRRRRLLFRRRRKNRRRQRRPLSQRKKRSFHLLRKKKRHLKSQRTHRRQKLPFG